MTLTITIEMDNDAFSDGPHEAGRILRVLAAKVENGADYAPCMDVNGNKVGELNISED